MLLGEVWEYKGGPPGILFALRHSKTPKKNANGDFDAGSTALGHWEQSFPAPCVTKDYYKLWGGDVIQSEMQTYLYNSKF